jgi:hypothetical protein
VRTLLPRWRRNPIQRRRSLTEKRKVICFYYFCGCIAFVFEFQDITNDWLEKGLFLELRRFGPLFLKLRTSNLNLVLVYTSGKPPPEEEIAYRAPKLGDYVASEEVLRGDVLHSGFFTKKDGW